MSKQQKYFEFRVIDKKNIVDELQYIYFDWNIF